MGCLDQNPPPFNNQQEYNVWLYQQLVALDGCTPDAPDDPGCVPEQLEHKNFNNAQTNGVQPGEFYAGTENGRPGETRVMVSEEFMGIEDGDSIWIECKEYTPDHYSKTDYPTSKYVKFYVPGDPDQFPAIGETVEVSDCDPECPESAPQMVFYGVKPPDEAPVGAIFTDENTIKSFVHQGEGVWIEHTPCVGDGDGGSVHLTAVEFTGYRTRVYQGTPFSDKTIFSEVYWETQQGIHFEDEITVEVDMDHTDTWLDAHEMSDDELAANDIGIRFNKETGGLAFNFDWKNTNDGPWDPQANFPCARLRVTVTNRNLENAEDFVTKSSEPMYVFPEYKQDPALDTPTSAHPGANC